MLNVYLSTAIKNEASDLHLQPNSIPHIRKKSSLRAVGEHVLTEEESRDMIFSMLNEDQREYLERHHEIDYAINLEGKGRFRVNAYKAMGNYEAVIRLLSTTVKTIDELHLPPITRQLALKNNGLVLVAGPTGSGKSTTLAAMIDAINSEKTKRIFTIENPVEIIHTNKKGLISQREVGSDTESFERALRSVLRQDPDVILIGEIRDKDTAVAAIQAAQTGHLVFSTIHAGSAEETISRFINLFQVEDRDNMREALAIVLQGVVVQKLVMDKQRVRRPVLEVLVKTNRVEELIRNRNHQEKYREVISSGDIHGMQTMEQVLMQMVQKGIMDPNTAIASAQDPRTLRMELKKSGHLRTTQEQF